MCLTWQILFSLLFLSSSSMLKPSSVVSGNGLAPAFSGDDAVGLLEPLLQKRRRNHDKEKSLVAI